MMMAPSKKLSEYLTSRSDGELGWVLKQGAPDDIKQEFERYRKIKKSYAEATYPHDIPKWLQD